MEVCGGKNQKAAFMPLFLVLNDMYLGKGYVKVRSLLINSGN